MVRSHVHDASSQDIANSPGVSHVSPELWLSHSVTGCVFGRCKRKVKG
jgi:hypothetical protein